MENELFIRNQVVEVRYPSVLACQRTWKPVVFVKHVSFHYRAADRQKDNLASFLFVFFLYILGTAEAQCEFWLSFTAGLQPP